jgi:AraC-like DNA-binding protein/DNA-binding NarL/FixJ family response regulator
MSTLTHAFVCSNASAHQTVGPERAGPLPWIKSLPRRAWSRQPVPLNGNPVRSELPSCGGGRGEFGNRVNVWVSHAEPLICAGLLAVLSKRGDFVVTAHDLVDDRPPIESPTGIRSCVVVTDLSSAVQLLRGGTNAGTAQRQARVIVVTRTDHEGDLALALQMGVQGYVLIDAPIADLIEAVLKIARGGCYVSGAMGARQVHVVGHDTAKNRAMSTALSPCPEAGKTIVRGGLAPGALRKVRAHMEERLAEKVELRELACIAGLSDCHFSRAFKQSVGLPPHRYLVRCRVQAAANMIRQTELNLSEISLDAGFSDQSHFTRTFVREMGETPSGFRHRHR